MRRIITSIISNILMVVLPLLFAPRLILHIKILIIIATIILVWLTQPSFSVEDTRQNQQKDKYSVLLILIMSVISVATPVVIWAYFFQNKDGFNAMSIAGIITIVIGLTLRMWSVLALGRFFTPTVQIREDHRLITGGPYTFIRHPSYLGAFLVIVSPSLILETWLGFIIACFAMGIAYRVRISIEESEMIAHFGSVYSNYKMRTKKLFPFIW